jgi:hypothetical protein
MLLDERDVAGESVRHRVAATIVETKLIRTFDNYTVEYTFLTKQSCISTAETWQGVIRNFPAMHTEPRGML